jgi:diguanylate cyclase (GGDEF)-like protein
MQAITDTLTGFTTGAASELGRREVERTFALRALPVCADADIDSLKQINDIYGHLTGDRAWWGSPTCAQELRQIDLLGRYGGDEFVVLLFETGSRTPARRRRAPAHHHRRHPLRRQRQAAAHHHQRRCGVHARRL